ncbi:hypothetical protein EXU85_30085 [Spirosoma sp. KCTC 42546]|uniref:hypothetical protein n=1 Tax=Spirosoma sp. KCTC 42546 TaxID=2520506 RepID=UPI00115B2D4B|nr:hypothetical protein [Spirosoma sp. KCTC 42546]QDK82630.1 hypothetical protein EXU85_30085 [Spirosoma sp. KCTC 42546]
MATANYKLTLDPLIDTIFVFEIGGHYVDPDELEGSLDNVFISEAGIRIRLELGGIERQAWNLEVSIENDEETLHTIPEIISGKIGRGGGSWFDRTCPLV